MTDPILSRFVAVRAATEALAARLSPEDQQLQSQPDCSPTKWHRGHTTWFFETLLLAPGGVPPLRPAWAVLFNSYYESLGARHPRPQRGLVSRPTAAEVGAWRGELDEAFVTWWSRLDEPARTVARPLVELGLAHEEQHQELLLTDILHAFSLHPHRPAYRGGVAPPRAESAPLTFVPRDGGVVEIGASRVGFAFDNEGPRHRVFLEPFALANRPLTVREWRAFADAGGYREPLLWLSEGWAWVQANGVRAPLHTRYEDGTVFVFTLDGEREADLDAPIGHLSFYEADAIARFMDARLPTEAEWELCAAEAPVEGNFRESGWLTPVTSAGGGALLALYGDVWEWTASAYAPYPGYRPAAGAVGEYNGKFMVNQLVLRGGSCFTPAGHVRASYRNFWPSHTQFQVTGVRLARDRDL